MPRRSSPGTRQRGLACIVLAVGLLATGAVMAQSNALTPQERAAAMRIEERGSTRRTSGADGPRIQGLDATTAGRERRSVITSVLPLGTSVTAERASRRSADGDPESVRRAEISRYDYATGATTRTIVNLETSEVLDVATDVNYATPLAPEEIDEARQLLLAAVPAIAAVVRGAATAAVKYAHLVPVATDPGVPRYGHRLVVMWLSKPRSSKKYLIDLSTREVAAM